MRMGFLFKDRGHHSDGFHGRHSHKHGHRQDRDFGGWVFDGELPPFEVKTEHGSVWHGQPHQENGPMRAREIFGRSETRRRDAPAANSSDDKARVFVCADRACQRRGNIGALVDGLKQEAAFLGAQIQVHTTGCLKRCDHGPIVAATPARSMTSASMTRSERVFTQVRQSDIQTIVESIID